MSQTLTSSPAGKLNVHAASADDQFALTQDLIQTLSYQPEQAPAISPPASGEKQLSRIHDTTGNLLRSHASYFWMPFTLSLFFLLLGYQLFFKGILEGWQQRICEAAWLHTEWGERGSRILQCCSGPWLALLVWLCFSPGAFICPPESRDYFKLTQMDRINHTWFYFSLLQRNYLLSPPPSRPSLLSFSFSLPFPSLGLPQPPSQGCRLRRCINSDALVFQSGSPFQGKAYHPSASPPLVSLFLRSPALFWII